MEEKEYYQVLEFEKGTVRVRNKPDFNLIAQSLKDLYDETVINNVKEAI